MNDWVTFCLAALVLLITPGPTNTLLATSGAVAGIKRSLALIPAEIGGYLITIIVLCLGIGPLVQSSPYLGLALQLGCGVYILFLAGRLWSESTGVLQSGEPIGKGRVFTTTLLNPKGIIFAFVIVPYLQDGLIIEALPYLAALTTIIGAVALCWIGAGVLLRTQLSLPADGILVRRTSAIVLGVFSVFVTTAAFRV